MLEIRLGGLAVSHRVYRLQKRKMLMVSVKADIGLLVYQNLIQLDVKSVVFQRRHLGLHSISMNLTVFIQPS